MQGRGFSPSSLDFLQVCCQKRYCHFNRKGKSRVIPSPTQSLRRWQDDGGSQRRLTQCSPQLTSSHCYSERLRLGKEPRMQRCPQICSHPPRRRGSQGAAARTCLRQYFPLFYSRLLECCTVIHAENGMICEEQKDRTFQQEGSSGHVISLAFKGLLAI